MMFDIGMYVLVAIISYLLGSIPFGLLISRRSARTDIRQVGSGRTGATNVLRTAGKKAAALVLILDLAKGAVAVIIAGLISGGAHPPGGGPLFMFHSAQALAGLAAIAGHSWPVFVKFRGGRGVATFLGALVVMTWPVAIFGGVVMIIVAGTSRYMSLGSITGAAAAFIVLIPLVILMGFPVEYLVFTFITAVFITVMHRDNISRLRAGTEHKLGEKVKAESPPAAG